MSPARQRPAQQKPQAWAAALSEVPWLHARRIVGYSRMIVAIYLAACVVVLALSPHWIDPWGKPVGTDFVNVWAAGKLALEGRPADAFDYERQSAMERQALPFKDGQSAPFYPWHYPPMFLAVAALLALLPYGAALCVWMAATLPVYLATIWRIIPGRQAMLAALAFPAVLVNLAHGQNGCVTAGLLGGGLLLVERRPWISGVLFGLLAYKPQFGVLIPLALLAGGCWRAILAAALTVAGTAAASWAVFGGEAWRAFFASLALTRAHELEPGAAGWEKIQSVFAAVRMFGGSVDLAYAAQAVFAVVAVCAVVWIWRRGRDMELKAAALAAATMMVTPYMFDYDLIVLALPIAWLVATGARRGFLPWEKITLLSAWLLPLVSRLMGGYLRLPVAPLIIALLLVVILRRAAVTHIEGRPLRGAPA